MANEWDPPPMRTPPTLAAATNDGHLFRLGLLLVGFRRHPFSIQVTQQHHTLSKLPVARYIDLASVVPPWQNRTCRDWTKLRYFRAVRRDGQSPRRCYLRVGDADVVALLEMRDETVRAAYVNAENEIQPHDDLRTVLCGEPTPLWTMVSSSVAETQEIHVLAVLCLGVDQDEGPKIGLLRSRARLQRGGERVQLAYGGDMDRRFHWDSCPSPPSEMRMPVVSWPAGMDLLRTDDLSLPEFDHVQITRRRCVCPLHWKESSVRQLVPESDGREARWWRPTKKQIQQSWRELPGPPYTPPRLSELARDVAFHLLVAHAPQFVDPVDCLVEAALYLGPRQVLANVLCFVKFQHKGPKNGQHRVGPRPSAPAKASLVHTVSTRMLETLDDIAAMGESSASSPRARLLLFVATMPDQLCIDAQCLPTAFPTVVVAADPQLQDPMNEPLRYLGNVENVDFPCRPSSTSKLFSLRINGN